MVGAVASIALGVISSGGEASRSGVASGRVVLDTPKSQLIHRAPRGHDTLPWRAELLADYLAVRPLRERIAKEVGIRTSELVVVHPPLTVPEVPTTLPARAARVANATFEDYILTVRFNELAPIISIEAAAPSREAAARLAGAASAAVQDTGTPSRVSPMIQGLVIESIGPVQSKELVDKPKLVLGVALGLGLFFIWCAAVALGSRSVEVLRALAGRPQAA